MSLAKNVLTFQFDGWLEADVTHATLHTIYNNSQAQKGGPERKQKLKMYVSDAVKVCNNFQGCQDDKVVIL
jgi:hypothetical protein